MKSPRQEKGRQRKKALSPKKVNLPYVGPGEVVCLGQGGVMVSIKSADVKSQGSGLRTNHTITRGHVLNRIIACWGARKTCKNYSQVPTDSWYTPVYFK